MCWQQNTNGHTMKDRTQKISSKLNSRKGSFEDKNNIHNKNTYDKTTLYKTQNLYHDSHNRKLSEQSSGEEFLGFLNDYIHQLKQPTSRGKSHTRELDLIHESIQQERLINKKLTQKVHSIKEVLADREEQLSSLIRKVDRLRDRDNKENRESKENQRHNHSKSKNEPRSKVSDFIARGRKSQFSEDSDVEISAKQYTENDVLYQRRKSAAVPRGPNSKALVSEEIENLISQTVGLKNHKKYNLI